MGFCWDTIHVLDLSSIICAHECTGSAHRCTLYVFSISVSFHSLTCRPTSSSIRLYYCASDYEIFGGAEEQNGAAGEQNGTAGEQNGAAGEQNGAAGEQNGAAGEQNGAAGEKIGGPAILLEDYR
jgi:hypothetical protein